MYSHILSIANRFFRKLAGIHEQPLIVENPELKRPVYADRHLERDFLILGNGATLNTHQKQIRALVEKFDLITMGGNNIAHFMHPHYHAFTNRKRFCKFAHTINDSKSSILLSPYLPFWLISEHYKGAYELLMYSADRDRHFDIENGIVLVDCRTVSVLLIAIALIMGAQRIFVAGMDGYSTALENKSNISYYTEKEFADLQSPKLAVYLRDAELECRRFLNEIAGYMSEERGFSFEIVTPTCYEDHYVDVSGYL